MNAPEAVATQSIATAAIGDAIEGGFFAGVISVNGKRYALIRAPKAQGQHDDTIWNDDWARVEGAQSFNDGLVNTEAMAAAGSEIAQWARAQNINGFADWYIPAQDELEILYRNLKPTAETNTLWVRSGINVSAVPPTYPYTETSPAQTPLALFQDGGTEAFDPVWYWSSTQHAGYDDFAWCQHFGYGGQGSHLKGIVCRVVLVRRVPL